MEGASQKTRASFLLDLRDLENKSPWQQFVEIYTPIIFGYCRQRGLQNADAADVTQEVMRAVVRAIQKFEDDPQRGRFRGWLLQVCRTKLNNHLAHQQRHPDPSSPSAIHAILDKESADGMDVDDPTWDQEYNRQVFQWAAKRVRPQFRDGTWDAFWRVVIADEDPKEVASSLNMSLGAVYIAKSRVLSKLREEIASIDGQNSVPALN